MRCYSDTQRSAHESSKCDDVMMLRSACDDAMTTAPKRNRRPTTAPAARHLHTLHGVGAARFARVAPWTRIRTRTYGLFLMHGNAVSSGAMGARPTVLTRRCVWAVNRRSPPVVVDSDDDVSLIELQERAAAPAPPKRRLARVVGIAAVAVALCAGIAIAVLLAGTRRSGVVIPDVRSVLACGRH